MADPQQIQIPPGHVCVTTYGMLTHQTTSCLLEARSFSERNGLNNAKWYTMPASLVEKARNEAVRNMLKEGAGWLLFVDGDCTFPPDAILRVLQTAYAETPHADVVGGYCPLRGDLALPTIDTGTGTWESWFPNSGTVEVMRTGGAFLLTKRHVFEALKDPWFRMRVPARAVDFIAEIDNFCRIKFDGTNPFRDQMRETWDKMEKCARDDPSVAPEQFTPVEVGEDSGFCDRVKLAWFRIYVNTDIACGHVDTRVLTGADHKKAMDESAKTQRMLCGVLV